MIPEGWTRHKFGAVTRIAEGQVDPRNAPYRSMTHIGPENVTRNTGQISGCQSCEEIDLISGKYEFDENSIVYSKIRPNLNKVCLPKWAGVCSADMYPIWPVQEHLNLEFLYQYMLGPIFVKQAVACSMRTGMPKVNRADLNGLLMEIPSLPEQRRIAEILSTWDRSIEAVEALIANARAQKKALMQRLLTGSKRLPGFADVWPITTLDKTAQVLISNVDKKLDEKEQAVRLCNYMDVYSFNRIESDMNFMVATAAKAQIQKFGLRVGDVLITKDSETPDDIAIPSYVGSTAPDLVCGYHLAIIRPRNGTDGQFLKFYFEHPHTRQYFASRANGATRFGLTIDAIQTAPIALPPYDEQKRIGEVISAAELEIARLQPIAAALRKEKAALMQQLLTGKRRVKLISETVA